jgi:amidase
LTEIFFEEAIARAKQLDAERKDDPSKALPPLWGLPISLKDSFQVPGIDYSCGIASLVNEPSKEYSVLSKLLVDLGAVLYVKTNVPRKSTSFLACKAGNNGMQRHS